MSREVRRVPVDWKHPTEPDIYGWTTRRPAPSRLLKDGERFHALMDDFPGRLSAWEAEGEALAARTGSSWAFDVAWYLNGYNDCHCHPGETSITHPAYRWSDDGMTEIPVVVSTEDELHALKMEQHAGDKPDPADYMPVFEQPEAELGWVLYETVSEGCPSTPVFATAEELIEHLVTVGEDYAQKPYRRAAAEALVQTGHSFGSFALIGGRLLDGARDLDRLTQKAES